MHFLLLIFKRLVCRAQEDPIKSWLNVELAVSFKVLYQAPHDRVKARHVLQRGKHWVDAVLDSQKILLSKFSRRQNFGWKINSDTHTLDCSQPVRRTRLFPPPPLPRGNFVLSPVSLASRDQDTISRKNTGLWTVYQHECILCRQGM